MYAVTSSRTGNSITLSAFDCTPEVDCACVPPGPTSFEAWHALGFLDPGTYVVSIGSLTETFRVPGG